MALQDTDYFLVNRAGTGYRNSWSSIVASIDTDLPLSTAFTVTGDPVTEIESIVPYTAAYGIKLPTAGVNDYNEDGAIRYKSSNNKLEMYYAGAWNTASGGTAFGSTPPSPATEGDVWYDTDVGRSYVYYFDGTSAQWVEMNPAWDGGTPPNSIGTLEITDGSVTPAKLSTGGPNWTTDGNVSIGASTADSLLHLSETDATAYDAAATDGQVGVGPTIYLENPANSNATVGGQIVFGMRSTEEQARIGATGGTSPALTFGTADAERVRIDSSGDVGIGTNNPSSKLDVDGTVQVGTVGDGNELLRFATDRPWSFFQVGTEQDTSLDLRCDSNKDFSISSRIDDGASLVTNFKVLGDTRRVGINTDAPLAHLHVTAMPFQEVAVRVNDADNVTLFQIDRNGKMFLGEGSVSPTNDTTSTAANVYITAGGRLKRSTSSRRYKADIVPLEDSYADAILNVEPVFYRSIASGDSDHPDWTYYGFIAEDVAEIEPRLVHWTTHKTVPNEDGTRSEVELDEPVAEGVQYDRFVPHLLSIVKRQQEAIKALESRVTDLEGN